MKITINIESQKDAANACREVAKAIDEGYTNGIVGWSGKTWAIKGAEPEEEEEPDFSILTEMENGKYVMSQDEVCAILEKIIGEPAECYDSCIDDGSDDEDDEYVMKDCFSCGKYRVRIYYGNNTLNVGWVRIEKED